MNETLFDNKWSIQAETKALFASSSA